MGKEKKEKPFHNPFGGLKLAKPEPAKPAPRPAPRPAKARPPEPELDEQALFLSSVGEVEPVRGGPPRVGPPPPPSAAQVRILDQEEEALLELFELVAGDGSFDLADSDEYMEGAVQGLDPRILRRLRAGEYVVQGHLDLHGHTRDEARASLSRFVEASRRKGHRCVLVITGRGLHSKDQLPVIKEQMKHWLARGGIARQVLAFSTARPHDGGTGAVYLLLRR